MKVSMVNSWSAMGLRVVFLALCSTAVWLVGIRLNSGLAAFLLASALLTASNVYLRRRFGFRAFSHEIKGHSGDFWGKFQLVYFLIAGLVAGYISSVTDPVEAALLFAIPGGFCLAEVFAKAITDRIQLGHSK